LTITALSFFTTIWLNLYPVSILQRLSPPQVVEALNFILENQSRRGQFFNNTIDLDFASPQWQKLLFVEQENKTKIVRRHLEVCVFSYLMAELRSGDICVKGSENYADYREQLLPWSECLPLIDQYCADLGFANNAACFVEQLKSWLTDSAAVVDAGYPDNRQLVINDLGEPVLKKSVRHELSPAAKVLIAETATFVNEIKSLWLIDFFG